MKSMKKRCTALVYIACAFAMMGCTPAVLTPFKDQAFTGKPFKRMLVVTTIKDADERSLVEKTVSSQLAERNVTGVPSTELPLPEQADSDEKVTEFLLENGIDSILSLQLTGKERRVETSADLMLDVFENKWQTAANIDYKPLIYFVIELYDVSSGKLVWTALSLSTGNGYDGAHTWSDSLAEAAVNQLQQNRFIQ